MEGFERVNRAATAARAPLLGPEGEKKGKKVGGRNRRPCRDWNGRLKTATLRLMSETPRGIPSVFVGEDPRLYSTLPWFVL